MKQVKINWLPQPRQLLCLNACGLGKPFGGEEFHPAIFDVGGYGGSAGGGKTDALLSIDLTASLKYPSIQIGFFRRVFPQLGGAGGAITRSHQLYREVAVYNEQKKKWTFNYTNAIVQFFHCQNPQDVYSYLSQQFDILLIDEGTQFEPQMIDYLITRNRATITDVNFKPFTLIATNPGNVGHDMFKQRFIDLLPWEKVHDFKYETGELRKHLFIPSKLTDNQILLTRDPGYPSRLSTDPKIKRMLLEGVWDNIEGSYFEDFRQDIHVCKAFSPKHSLVKYGGIDWGYFPGYFVFTAGVVAPVKEASGVEINRVFTYKTIQGQKLTPEEWGERIRNEFDLEEFESIACDPSMFKSKEDGSMSLIDQLKTRIPEEFHYLFKPANNDRIQGWMYLHKWLSIAPDNAPYMIICDSCNELIKTIPQAQHDLKKPEDIDPMGGRWHWLDSLRYMTNQIKFIEGKSGQVFDVKINKTLTDTMGIDPRDFAHAGRSNGDWRAL